MVALVVTRGQPNHVLRVSLLLPPLVVEEDRSPQQQGRQRRSSARTCIVLESYQQSIRFYPAGFWWLCQGSKRTLWHASTWQYWLRVRRWNEEASWWCVETISEKEGWWQIWSVNKTFTFVSQNLPFLISVSDNRVDRTFSPGFKVLVIYQTRETVRFHQDIEKPRRELKIRCAVEYFWRKLWCLDSWWNTVLNAWCIYSI